MQEGEKDDASMYASGENERGRLLPTLLPPLQKVFFKASFNTPKMMLSKDKLPKLFLCRKTFFQDKIVSCFMNSTTSVPVDISAGSETIGDAVAPGRIDVAVCIKSPAAAKAVLNDGMADPRKKLMSCEAEKCAIAVKLGDSAKEAPEFRTVASLGLGEGQRSTNSKVTTFYNWAGTTQSSITYSSGYGSIIQC